MTYRLSQRLFFLPVREQFKWRNLFLVFSNSNNQSSCPAAGITIVLEVDDFRCNIVIASKVQVDGIFDEFVLTVNVCTDRLQERRHVLKDKESRLDLLNELDRLNHQRIAFEFVAFLMVGNRHTLTGRRCNNDIQVSHPPHVPPHLYLMEYFVLSFLQRHIAADVTTLIEAFVVVFLNIQSPFNKFYCRNTIEVLLFESITSDAGTTKQTDIGKSLW